MSSTVSFSHFSRCLFTIAKPAKVVLNKKARIPAYLLSLELSPELLEEHKSLFKKDVYSSSAQITNQHTIEDLEGAQILTMINFPRKQIGPKMSDCLTCGVLPFGPDVDPQYKRDNTICVQPCAALPPDGSSTPDYVGAPVGIFPVAATRRTTNPRDLTWDEFERFELLTGTVEELAINEKLKREDGLQACDGTVDFGPLKGAMKSRIWLRAETLANSEALDRLKGRQVLALTNLDSTECADLFDVDTAAVLTVNGHTTIEPAKAAENGYKLA